MRSYSFRSTEPRDPVTCSISNPECWSRVRLKTEV